MLDPRALVEARIKQIEEQRDSLLKDPTIAKYLVAVKEYVQKVNERDMTIHEQRNVAQCLQNSIDHAASRKGGRGLFEATTEDAISFLGIQLPVISALLPSLALNDIAVVQALDRRIAAVFYFDVKYGSNKGYISSGETMLSAISGHNVGKSGRRYAMARVVDELVGTGDGRVYVKTITNPGLINLQNVKFEKVENIGTVNEVRTLLGSSDANGNVTGTKVAGTGSIDASGQIDVTFTGLATADQIRITYDYQHDLPEDAYGNKTGVPEVDFSVSQGDVRAIDFPIRSKYSIGAALDLMKAHGVDLESEVVKYLGHEVKFTIDQVGLDMIDETASPDNKVAGVRQSADPCADWDATLKNGEPWIWKKHEIKDRFEEGSNNIFEKTKRAVATFIVCGNNVARVLRQLSPDFKPAAGLGKTPPTGPMKIGELDGRTIIQNPFKKKNYYTMGYRGDNYLMAGFIYCPYIPLFATPTLITSDLMAQKGFLSSAGFKVINPGMFCQGMIKNLGIYG